MLNVFTKKKKKAAASREVAGEKSGGEEDARKSGKGYFDLFKNGANNY